MVSRIKPKDRSADSSGMFLLSLVFSGLNLLVIFHGLISLLCDRGEVPGSKATSSFIAVDCGMTRKGFGPDNFPRSQICAFRVHIAKEGIAQRNNPCIRPVR
jgi:hypothetical protein